MGNFVNLTGQVFGKLFVIERAEDYISPKGQKCTQWLCQCSCGRCDVFPVLANNLTRGRTTCCEKCQFEKIAESKFQDLTGQTFGQLTVIERAEDRITLTGQNKTRWICRCSCGRTPDYPVLAGDLKSGSSTACKICAHEKTGRNRIKDLKDQVFGYLRVIAFDKVEKEFSYWLCYCDPELGGCGNTVSVRSLKLNQGQTSCGCQLESWIASALKRYCIENYGAEVEREIIINPVTGYWLRCDIYIPNDIYIEVNGEHHYEINNWHRRKAIQNDTTPENEFEYQQYKDHLKKEYAEERGLYIEIDLRVIKTVDDAINFIERKIKEVL